MKFELQGNAVLIINYTVAVQAQDPNFITTNSKQLTFAQDQNYRPVL